MARTVGDLVKGKHGIEIDIAPIGPAPTVRRVAVVGLGKSLEEAQTGLPQVHCDLTDRDCLPCGPRQHPTHHMLQSGHLIIGAVRQEGGQPEETLNESAQESSRRSRSSTTTVPRVEGYHNYSTNGCDQGQRAASPARDDSVSR